MIVLKKGVFVRKPKHKIIIEISPDKWRSVFGSHECPDEILLVISSHVIGRTGREWYTLSDDDENNKFPKDSERPPTYKRQYCYMVYIITLVAASHDDIGFICRTIISV